MKTEHTPEPWRVEIGEQPETIALLCTSGLAHFELVSDSPLGDISADASRIVACVNACAGIETELLEILTDNDKTISGLIRSIEKQRDELLSAAEAIEIDAEECLDFDEFTAMLVPMASYHKLIEAIASVKEK